MREQKLRMKKLLDDAALTNDHLGLFNFVHAKRKLIYRANALLTLSFILLLLDGVRGQVPHGRRLPTFSQNQSKLLSVTPVWKLVQ